jgi:hypothetical protein
MACISSLGVAGPAVMLLHLCLAPATALAHAAAAAAAAAAQENANYSNQRSLRANTAKNI